MISEDRIMAKDSSDVFYDLKEYVSLFLMLRVIVHVSCVIIAWQTLKQSNFQSQTDLPYSNAYSQVESMKVKYEKFLDILQNFDTTSDKFKEINAGDIDYLMRLDQICQPLYFTR